MPALRSMVVRMPVIPILDTAVDAMYYSAKIRRNYVDQLCTHPKLFLMEKEELEELQYKALKQAFMHHYKKCKFYHDYCRGQGIKPDDIHNVNDIVKIPQIPAETFRQGGITSVPARKIKNVVTTSGTRSGNPAYTFRDFKSGTAWIKVLIRAFINSYIPQALEIDSLKNKYNDKNYNKNVKNVVKFALTDMQWELFFPPPEESSTWASQLAGIASLLFEKILRIPFAWHLKGFEFNEKEALDLIKEHSKTSATIWAIGFPYVLENIMKYMDEHDEPPLELDPTGSNICVWITGGGWKATEPIPREEFEKRISKHFGVNSNLIVDLYGFGEADVFTVDFCKANNWHLYPHVRYVVRDPETLEPCAEGEKGLMTVYDASITCYPAFIITDDFVRVSDIKKCECGQITQNLIKFEERAPDIDLKSSRMRAKKLLSKESIDMFEKIKEKSPRTGIGI